jgi:hypothetical protein
VCGGGQEKKRRGGTENVPGIVGFGKACQIARDRMARGELEQLKKMRDRLWERIEQFIPNVEFFGCVENRLPNTLGCGFEGANGETLLIALDMEGISVSTGSACSSGMGSPSPVLSAMRLPLSKINSSLRFSLGWGNTFDDIDLVAKVFPHPKLKRSEELIFDKGNRIAERTGEGDPIPELHAEPVETEIPSISSAINNVSPLAPSNPQPRVFGRRFSTHPKNSTFGINCSILSHSRSRIFFNCSSSPLAIRSLAIWQALPKPTIPGTFSVPPRRFFSCPPPHTGEKSVGVPRLINNAPTPFGPYIL